MASVRYIVSDVDQSVAFYRDRLGFTVEKHNPGKFAALKLEDLHLFINAPGAGSAGKAGGHPTPGGWNRFMVVTKDLDGMIAELRSAGAPGAEGREPDARTDRENLELTQLHLADRRQRRFDAPPLPGCRHGGEQTDEVRVLDSAQDVLPAVCAKHDDADFTSFGRRETAEG